MRMAPEHIRAEIIRINIKANELKNNMESSGRLDTNIMEEALVLINASNALLDQIQSEMEIGGVSVGQFQQRIGSLAGVMRNSLESVKPVSGPVAIGGMQMAGGLNIATVLPVSKSEAEASARALIKTIDSAVEKLENEAGMEVAADALAQLGNLLTPVLREHLDCDALKVRINEIAGMKDPIQAKLAIIVLINGIVNKVAVVEGVNVQGSIDKLRELRESLMSNIMAVDSPDRIRLVISAMMDDVVRSAGFESKESQRSINDLRRLSEILTGDAMALGGLAIEANKVAAVEGAGASKQAAVVTSAKTASQRSRAVGAAENMPVIAEVALQPVRQQATNIIAIDTSIPNYDKLELIYRLRGYETCRIDATRDSASDIAAKMKALAKGRNITFSVLLNQNKESINIAMELLGMLNAIVGLMGAKTDARSMRNLLENAKKDKKIVITDEGIERTIKEMMESKGFGVQAQAKSLNTNETNEQILNEDLVNLAY